MSNDMELKFGEVATFMALAKVATTWFLTIVRLPFRGGEPTWPRNELRYWGDVWISHVGLESGEEVEADPQML